MRTSEPLYHHHRFPGTIISYAVRLYYRFQLSLRDVEELPFERGVVVTYESIPCWCAKFSPASAQRAKQIRPRPGMTWHLDETFVSLHGDRHILWRAVDQHGVELDILLQKHREKVAVKQFFSRLLGQYRHGPNKIVTDKLRSYWAAKAEIPAQQDVRHVFVGARARVTNRAENSHQPTRERERRMKGLRGPTLTEAFLSSFGPVGQHFALKRHHLSAARYRAQLAKRFALWRAFTGLARAPSGTF